MARWLSGRVVFQGLCHGLSHTSSSCCLSYFGYLSQLNGKKNAQDFVGNSAMVTDVIYKLVADLKNRTRFVIKHDFYFEVSRSLNNPGLYFLVDEDLEVKEPTYIPTLVNSSLYKHINI